MKEPHLKEKDFNTILKCPYMQAYGLTKNVQLQSPYQTINPYGFTENLIRKKKKQTNGTVNGANIIDSCKPHYD